MQIRDGDQLKWSTKEAAQAAAEAIVDVCAAIKEKVQQDTGKELAWEKKQ